jgi:hypothetical protein
MLLRTRAILLILAGLLVATAIGAIVAILLDEDEMQARGTIVMLGPPDSFRSLDRMPFCVDFQHFCLVKLQSGQFLALYTYDTHPFFRTQGCTNKWLPDFAFTDPATGRESQGWFRSGCSGATFRMYGEAVSGPTARDMDQFSVRIIKDAAGSPTSIEVDTRRLICGKPRPGAEASPCPFAPLPQ